MLLGIPIPTDFSFLETVSSHGWRRLLPFSWDENAQVLERTEELGLGNVVSLRIYEKDRVVFVESSGDGGEDEIVRRVRRMLQLDLAYRPVPYLLHLPS